MISRTLPVTLYNNLLTFRQTNKKFDLQGDLLKMITDKNYIVDFATLSDQKLLYEFAKELFFDERALGKKSTRNKSLIRLFKSPGLMVSDSGVSSSHKKNSFPMQECCHLILMSFVIEKNYC